MTRLEWESLYDRIFEIYADSMEHLDMIDRTSDARKIRQTALDLKTNISELLYDLEAHAPEEGDED